MYLKYVVYSPNVKKPHIKMLMSDLRKSVKR